MARRRGGEGRRPRRLGPRVHAYQLTPYEVSQVLGAALPFMELALGGLLLVGLATRLVAMLSAALLAVFAAGVASAWAGGLVIDCGCFGGGGELAAGADADYRLELARSAALAVVAAALAIWPATRCSADARLLGTTTPSVERGERR